MTRDNGIGKSPDEVDAEAVSNNDYAAHLGVELETDGGTDADPDAEEPTKAELWAVVKSQQKAIEDQQETIDALEERVEELEDETEQAEDVRTDLAAALNSAVEDAEEAREIARSASATANQVRSEVEDDEDGQSADHNLPGDVKPSSSPLDFFANCSTFGVKRRFVEQQNKTNTYRAVEVAQKWEEYANRRTDGTGIFWTRENVESALIEVQGQKPHRETIRRVWKELKSLGGSDVTEKTRQVGRTQEPTEIIAMSMETAEGLTENRYVGLDLLDADGGTAGGVTPVVTGPEAADV